MAEHGELEYATAEGNDLPAHEASYVSFVHFTYVGLILVINIMTGLGVGGVHGHWWIAFAVFVFATICAIIDLVGNSKAAGAFALVLSLIALAGTA
jgi:Bacterial aa3 type cytochrome c oxidase subunit IV